ncbi:MAG: hypothetical protein KKG89_15215 [Alphaproteobacteria bacterium]|nr:hypothetical protein [Alphaproteobacteria bacterium]
MMILQGAMARMRAQPVALAAWWILASIATVGVEQGARLAGIDPGGDLPSQGDAWYRIARALLEGLSSAAGFRLILQGRLWFDRGFVVCAAILTTIAVVTGFAIASPYSAGLGGGAQAALVAVMFYLGLKLTLWPLGPLMGRDDLTLTRGWSAMHGATLGLALAFLLSMLPLFAVGMVYVAVPPAELDRLPAIIVDAVTVQALTLFALAMSATVYQLRVENPATVADVFD